MPREAGESLLETREARQWVPGFEDSQSFLDSARTIFGFGSVVNRKILLFTAAAKYAIK